MKPLMNNAANHGELYFEETGERINASTLATDFSEFALVRKGRFHHFGSGVRVALGSHVISDQLFDVKVVFEGNALRRVDLCAITGKEGGNWADWSMENEMATKKLHEIWAAKVFERELTVKPFFTPNRVMPFEVKDDSPRYAQFSWGQVCSCYDSKGSSSYMSLLYGEHDSA